MARSNLRVVVADSDKMFLGTSYYDLVDLEVDVVGLTDNGPDAFEMIRELEPDLVFANIFLLEEDGFWLMDRLRNAPLESMPAVAMMVPMVRDDMVERVRQAGAFAAVDVPTLAMDLKETIRLFRQTHRMAPYFAREDRIRDILDSMSLDRSLKGYEYLVTAILLTCKSHTFYRAMTTVVYPETARLHDATATGVERCIRHALDAAWVRGDLERQYAYFGNTIDGNRGKPTNSEFIARITEALRLEAY